MSKINNHNCGIHPIAKCAKPPQKKMQVKLKYRIYSIDEKGMLEEPKHYWGDTIYDNYDSIEEAFAAIIKQKIIVIIQSCLLHALRKLIKFKMIV